MKILVLSNTAWANNNSFGNSFSNIFSGIPDLEFASIYCRYGKPDNEFEMRYFKITEKSLLRNLADSGYPSGCQVFTKREKTEELSQKQKKYYDNARKKRWQIFFWVRDLIWKIGRWDSLQLRTFLDDFQPDLIFQPIYYSNYLTEMAVKIQKYTKTPMIGYISDDNYTLKQFNLSPLYWVDRLHKRKKVKKAVQKCKILYVISDIQKKDYEVAFQVPCKVLTKCADFDENPVLKENFNNPLQFVFTGNIGSNRWKSLALIARALNEINKNSIQAQLRIYTATPLSKKMEKELNIGESSILMGSVPATEIEEIQKNADILVHAEGLDLKSRLAVRQSFSTKIVDYLKMARPIFAVGPKDVASVEHLLRNDAAIVASSYEEVFIKLKNMIANPEVMQEYAKKGYACGKKYHNRNEMQRMLMEDFETVIK